MAQGDPSSPIYTAGADASASGTITAINQFVELTLGGRDTLTAQITGTYTGALSIQGTVNGTAWVTLTSATTVTNVATSAQAATIASASQGIFQVGVGGLIAVRVTALAAVTGTATVALNATDGNGYVALDAPLPAGSANIGTVFATPSNGTNYGLTTAATTNAAAIKGSAGNLYEVTISNVTATAAFVKFYNKATAPTVGTDVPLLTISAPANSTQVLQFGATGKRFATGIASAVTGLIAATDTTATVVGIQVSATYI